MCLNTKKIDFITNLKKNNLVVNNIISFGKKKEKDVEVMSVM